MKIAIKLNCYKSSSYPKFRIYLDDQILFDMHAETPQVSLETTIPINSEKHNLIVEHYDKQSSDTWVDADGKISHDRAVELVSISIDNMKIPNVILYSKPFYPIWPEHLINDSTPKYISNNVWFGFNGKYVFDFDYPFEKTYYQYYWDMEIDSNQKFQKTDAETNEDYFEAYGLKIKVDQTFNFTLTDLKKMIEDNEPQSK